MPELKQIRAAHASANPKDDNPAWKFCHRDLGYVLSLYDAEVAETDALKCRLTISSTLEKHLAAKVTGLEAALGVEKGEKTRYRDALVCIQVFSKTQIECLDQSDTEEDNTERANAVWINEKVNAVLGDW